MHSFTKAHASVLFCCSRCSQGGPPRMTLIPNTFSSSIQLHLHNVTNFPFSWAIPGMPPGADAFFCQGPHSCFLLPQPRRATQEDNVASFISLLPSGCLYTTILTSNFHELTLAYGQTQMPSFAKAKEGCHREPLLLDTFPSFHTAASAQCKQLPIFLCRRCHVATCRFILLLRPTELLSFVMVKEGRPRRQCWSMHTLNATCLSPHNVNNFLFSWAVNVMPPHADAFFH
mmetsp:Transcript_7171/g.13604  ORF Transcript_7171/g.13604 Transcript_7171/m.13604 type:complete len:230 (-) Transcript_7171:112-801(-)